MRIFDYLNISNERSIFADSGFHVQRNVIQHILQKRNDYHFFLTVPYSQLSKVSHLSSDLLTFLPYHYSGGSGNKYHFNTNELWNLMDMWHKDWDLVINNEVILGNQFRNMFCYKSHFNIPIINYIHWVNTTEEDTQQQWDTFNSIRWCYNTYCNSQFGRQLVLKNLHKIYQEQIAEYIENKLKVLPVGFNDKELLEHKSKGTFDKTTLIFNHRISQYTGYEKLLKECNKIYKSGTKDFQLIFTNPATSMTRMSLKYPFVKVYEQVPTYEEYIKLLWKSDICFGLHNGQNQWSIAFLEALFCNNIPITTNDIFYKEMLPFKTFELKELKFVIENIDGITKPKYDLERYYWRNLVNQYIDMYESNIAEYESENDTLKNPEQSKVLNQVKSFFKTHPIIDKQEILSMRGKLTGSGVGCQTPYSKYRKELLKVTDDVIGKEKSYYRLKDMSKANRKPVDWWLDK